MRYYLILLFLFFVKQTIYSQNTDNSNDTTTTNTKDYSTSDYPNSKRPIENSLPLKYKVHRIKEIDEAYIIDIDVRDKTRYFRYTIISLKCEKSNSEKIKQRKEYEFILFAYYPCIFISDPWFAYYTINDVRFGFKQDFHNGEIVTTPNLQGLYYIPPKK